MDLGRALQERGIRLRSIEPGDHRTTCPACSAQRKKKNDPCLSVTVNGDGHAVWNCWHCGSVGGTKETVTPRERAKKSYRKPNFKPDPAPPAKLLAWFKKRGIGETTVRRNRISPAHVWMPGADKDVWCIAFPYYRSGELVNVKYRDPQKRFRQEKDAQKIFYGIDDIAGSDDVVIVEGECDKLAFEEAGLRNVISVPDGAPSKVRDGAIDPADDAKFEYIWNCRDDLADVKRFFIATDSDVPGRALAEELARRLGKERCWRVRWPSIGDVERKDANEVLLEDGATVLRECVEYAEPWPIKSLLRASSFIDEVRELYESGPAKTLSTGWPQLDQYYRVRAGELTVVTGLPGSGKSEWVDALLMNMAQKHDWSFALCSFENRPAEHIAKLAEKHVRAPFYDGPTYRMGRPELEEAVEWLDARFFFLRADDDAPTVEWILDQAQAAVARHGIRGLVIDPYNEIEHKRPSGMTETEYVSQMLGKVKRWAAAAEAHVWFVAHPAKIQRNKDGTQPIPSLHEISGSANWSNKADIGVVVHRDYDAEAESGGRVGKTVVFVRKVRFKAVGRPGNVTFDYERATGTYSIDTKRTK